MRSALPCLLAVFACALAFAEGPQTVFQTSSPYAPELDIAADEAIIYGVDETFADRAESWKAQGYRIGVMTGISWGGYGAYYGGEVDLKVDEIQTSKSGRVFMHGDSAVVGYNVPSPAYVDFIQGYIAPAIDHGVARLYLEEPEFWAETGWSEGFQRQWKRVFGEDWVPPDSSVDAQWKASRLKYQLYHDALRDVMVDATARAAAQGRDLECLVPTHSLLNYAHWRIVTPMATLIDIPAFDGYVAQVWTGTSRTPNVYKGERKERTFETAFLEYGQMLHLARSAGKSITLLHDPIEDHPDRSWEDYKHNYEATVVASLLWNDQPRFEVMPWPSRIFRGKYLLNEDAPKDGERAGIPADYATEVLTVINALNDIADYPGQAVRPSVGVVVSDTMMFQRAAPHASDNDLSSFYAIALPLVKRGIHAVPTQLETIAQPKALDGIELLFLSYEGQKPLTPQYHDVIEAWVRGGGTLVYAGDGSDPYHHVAAWWNGQGENANTPADDLFARFDLDNAARNEFVSVGKGRVRVLAERPRKLAQYPQGDTDIAALLKAAGISNRYDEPDAAFFHVQRGPYQLAAAMEDFEACGTAHVGGRFVDLFDPMLRIVTDPEMTANKRWFLYDLEWLDEKKIPAKVIAAAARIRGETVTEDTLRFTARGPADTVARIRARLPHAPVSIHTYPEIPVAYSWDPKSRTTLLEFPNQARQISVELAWRANIR